MLWPRPQEPSRAGSLVIVGGSEDRSRTSVILTRLISLCDGGAPVVVVVDAASRTPSSFARHYQATFSELGAREVLAPRLDTPHDAEDPSFLRAIERAGAVYFAGGDQSRLVGIIRGTEAHRLLLSRFGEDGLVVGGTSAGASALSQDMIVRGESELWPRKGFVRVGVGLGFTDLIIDQHFSQRARLGRLVEAVAMLADRGACGVGVDENTALVLSPDGSGEVLGEGGVAVVSIGPQGDESWQRCRPHDIVSLARIELTTLRHGDRVWNTAAGACDTRGEG